MLSLLHVYFKADYPQPEEFYANQWSMHQPNPPSAPRQAVMQSPTSGQAPTMIRSVSGRVFQLPENAQENRESSSSSESESEEDGEFSYMYVQQCHAWNVPYISYSNC
jgi:hypothetical protein